jgi:hypothetical protein
LVLDVSRIITSAKALSPKNLKRFPFWTGPLLGPPDATPPGMAFAVLTLDIVISKKAASSPLP